MTGENDPGFGKTVAAQTPGKRAEEKVATDTKSFPDMSVSEMPGLIHELRVHQVELEMQHEELRKNQAETERSCKAYQDLWELSSVGCLIVDIDGRVTAVNRAGQRLFGKPKNALLKERFSMLVTPENEMSVNLMYERALETGIGEKQEIRILKPDGAIHICLLEVSSLGSEPGREQIQAVLTDITKLKQAEQTLRENEEKYRQLFENYTVSSDTTILSMNPAIENMTGWSPSECIDKHLASFVHPDDFSLAMEMGQWALQGDKPPIHEVRILSKSGKYVIGEFSIAPFI